jgi:uncharacterized membrane protein YfcA
MQWFIAFLIGVSALVYSTVGHGGASAYLAILAIAGFSPEQIKPTALVLNLLVSAVSFFRFRGRGFFNAAVFLPLAICSVPAAYYASGLGLDAILYKQILGGFLLIACVPLYFNLNQVQKTHKEVHFLVLMVCGLVLGALSGLLGIGGGVLLSPLLILCGWCPPKETSGVSALFIFVNSAAGLIGSGVEIQLVLSQSVLYLYIGMALTGALVGAWLGAKRFNDAMLKKTLAIVLMAAALKLIFGTH